MTNDFDPYLIAKRLLSFSDDYADKKAAFELLTEMKKPKLYTLANECNEASAAAKEQYAYRHPDYAAYIKDMVEAEKVCNRAKGKLEAERVRIDLLRTQSANERAVNKVLP
jgi:hypothetical protein